MRKVQFILMAPATLCAVFLVSWSAQSETIQEKPDSVSFFDVLDLPARIDEPKLVKSKDKYLLNCALANRSGEPIIRAAFDSDDGRLCGKTANARDLV